MLWELSFGLGNNGTAHCAEHGNYGVEYKPARKGNNTGGGQEKRERQITGTRRCFAKEPPVSVKAYRCRKQNSK